MPEDKTDQVIKLLEEILKWTRLQGWQNTKAILLETLKDDIFKLVYQYSDGRSSREIAKRVPISYKTVINYWNEWAKIGIVEPIKVRGGGARYQRLFSLEEFGIEISEVKTQDNEINEKEN